MISWLRIVNGILELCGPILDLYLRADMEAVVWGMNGAEDDGTESEQMAAYFDRVYRSISFWSWRKQAILGVIKKMAVARAGRIFYAAKNEQSVVSDEDVYRELVAVFN